MSKSLDQLGLKEEALPTAGTSLADLPEFGTFTPPPPPSDYRFELPKDLAAIYDVFDATINGATVQRVRAIFDRDHPLIIVQSKLGAKNGEPFETRIANNERERGKKGSGVIASDWDYLLRALGETVKPGSNRGYIEALRKHGGKQFGAKIRYSWICSTDRDIRVLQPGNPVPQVVEGHKGCGEKYYEEAVVKTLAPGQEVPYEITCQCGARLRAFANLDNFRA